MDYFERHKLPPPKKLFSPHWVKQDFMSFVEFIFIFYGYEPEKLSPMDFYIHVIDKLNLRQIIENSNAPYVPGRGIPLKEMCTFLRHKGIPIPYHLQFGDATQDTYVDAEGRLSKVKRKDQLQREHARSFAEIYWKNPKNQKTSANELVLKKEFKQCMALVEADEINPETQAGWISDLSPRSKVKKK